MGVPAFMNGAMRKLPYFSAKPEMPKGGFNTERQRARRITGRTLGVLTAWLIVTGALAQTKELEACNVVWTSQSKNSGESMPCGGGDIGVNVWVENGELLFYLSQSGMFDENNALLKAGRVRIRLSPNPFAGKDFKQQLLLRDGYVNISGSNGPLKASVDLWVDVFHPVVRVNVHSNQAVRATAAYETWRYADRASTTQENKANSWKWATVKVITRKDSIAFLNNSVLFYHRNTDSTVFDATVRHEGLQPVKDHIYNPLQHLVFGGSMTGRNMHNAGIYTGTYLDTDFRGWKLESDRPAADHQLVIALNTQQSPDLRAWEQQLAKTMQQAIHSSAASWQQTKQWWHRFWERSFIFIGGSKTDSNFISTETGRNYQLFRYMLGCNAYGAYPTKFNGGLFTYDPVLTDSSLHGTPDHRNWGGGVFTAQNQRLVYWPMLKSGDIDMMKSQFEFYRRLLPTAALRTQFYWKHRGASFTEQLENFGLPNIAEYGLKRPANSEPGLEYNTWLEYLWDTALEFCQMILETESYEGKDISTYMSLIESCLVFFDEHYQQLAKQRTGQPLDVNGKLILYPGSAAETFKKTNNSTSTIAALQVVASTASRSAYATPQQKKYFRSLLNRIPSISFRTFNGHTAISPAKTWERVNNVESPQLYPVFPWGLYGVGKPGLDTARNTWYYDTLAIKFRDYKGWKQDAIFAARLGLADEAEKLTGLKLRNSGQRFPTFWGPGFDWTPDHNHGGSGMIALQEMLLQTDDKKIMLFPAWNKQHDVHFRLHAPYKTIIEAILKNGMLEKLEVWPEERRKDVVNLLK